MVNKKISLGMLQQNVQEFKEEQVRKQQEEYAQALELLKDKLDCIQDEIIKASKEGKTDYTFTLVERYGQPVCVEEVKKFFMDMGLNVSIRMFPMFSEFSDLLLMISKSPQIAYQIKVNWK